MIQRILIGLFLCLATVASGQTYTFECICAQLSGDSCDVCPVTNIKARTFSGLIIYKNGDYFKWIDRPYTIRKLLGNNVQFLEQIPNPDNVTINLAYTAFSTVDGFIDSTNCNCNDGGIVTLVEGPGITISGDTISAVDTSYQNEGALNVTALGGNDAGIHSNTSGSTDIQIKAGPGALVTDGAAGAGGYIQIATNDTSATNEIQALSVATNIISLSLGGGSVTIAGAGINVASTAGSTITITGTEVDGSITNELQTLSVLTNTVTLSNSGGSFTIAGAGGNTVSTAGSTITITGTPATGAETIITAGTGIGVSGIGTSGSPYVVSNTGVTSVGLSLPSIFSVSGSPVTTTGTLTGTLATQTANTVFAGPTSGGAATPTFRALVSADIPALSYVTSVAVTVPTGLSVTGSPITSSGTFAFSLANDLAALEGLASTGIAVRTATDTWAQRTIMGSTYIGVADGNGVAGNPTITNLGVTTVNGSTGAITNVLTTSTGVTQSTTLVSGRVTLSAGSNSITDNAALLWNGTVLQMGTGSVTNQLRIWKVEASTNPASSNDYENIRLYNGNTTNGNWTAIHAYTSGGNVGAGIAFKMLNHSTAESSTHIFSRGPTNGFAQAAVFADNLITMNWPTTHASTSIFTGASTHNSTMAINGVATFNAQPVFLTNIVLGSSSVGSKITVWNNYSSTSLAANNNFDGVQLRNVDATNNNYTAISNTSSGGNIASGIAFQMRSHASAYSDVVFFTRGASGFGEAARIQDRDFWIGTATGTGRLAVVGSGATSGTYSLMVTNSGAATATASLAVLDNGFTGHGTNAPSQTLHVVGNARITGAYYDSNNDPGTSGQIMKSTNTGTDWVDLSSIATTAFTGTTNQTLRFSATNTLQNTSSLLNDGTNVSVGATVGGARFRVTGITSQTGIWADGGALTSGDALLTLSGTLTSGFAYGLNQNVTVTGGNSIGRIRNAATTGTASNAFLNISVANTSVGDPFVQFQVEGSGSGSIGMDNSDGRKMKISPLNNFPGQNANHGVIITNTDPAFVGIDRDAPAYPLDVNGSARSTLFINNAGVPTIAYGTGAGTVSGTSVIGGSNWFQITFTVGGSPVANGTIFTATLVSAFPTAAIATPGAVSALAATDISKFRVSASTGNTITVTANGTLSAGQYILNYNIGGY